MSRFFDDRLHAARQLADALHAYRGANPLVLAIPRGAVPLAAHVARALGGDLDVVLVRKLGAAGNPEFAVGAVGEDGWTHIADHARELGYDEASLERARVEQVALMRKRRQLYTPRRAPIAVAGRTCIVVDDGLATGSTMTAALHDVRVRGPAKLVCAIPVASPEGLRKVRPLADQVVCLSAPPDFVAVGQYYRDFGQVTDVEVAAILEAHERVH